MSPIEQFERSLVRVEQIFAELGMRYHLTGGAATIAYGEPRLTLDLDFVVSRDQLSGCLATFFRLASNAGCLYTEETVRAAVTSGRQFQLYDTASAAKLDFYPRELVPGELGRSVLIEVLPGVRMPVVSRADLIVAKLIWISKGSHKSRRDVRQLFVRADVEEQARTLEWAADRGMRTLLEEVLLETDEILE
uniref:Nucleotidyl transferase AbiEii/AbiGii toxin family protein n=1 Tax=Schlesneria paludicola TaxID=360056 RepID=A0A7C2JYE6_9PLAN